VLQRGIRYLVLATAVAAVGVPIASRLQAQTRCYFKDCLVFENGARICEVREVPCPSAS
jgi:hypothetical protein